MQAHRVLELGPELITRDRYPNKKVDDVATGAWAGSPLACTSDGSKAVQLVIDNIVMGDRRIANAGSEQGGPASHAVEMGGTPAGSAPPGQTDAKRQCQPSPGGFPGRARRPKVVTPKVAAFPDGTLQMIASWGVGAKGEVKNVDV